MAKIKSASEILGLTQPPLREYEHSDFAPIDAKLKKYWFYREGGEKNIRMFDHEKFFVDCGALNPEGAVIVQNPRYEKNRAGELCLRVDEPTRFARAQHLLSWYFYKSAGKEYAMQMSLEGAVKKFEVQPIETTKPMDEPF